MGGLSRLAIRGNVCWGNQMCAFQLLIPRVAAGARAGGGGGDVGSSADADIAYKKVADRSLLHPAIG